ncbi:hypothetical protein SAMN02910369_00463 [Lachnospiraceae bacterium NE2001]|nr:hypothetical protein SAMN02910369_00463 [Lachnospiraceae bacterium NE2001]
MYDEMDIDFMMSITDEELPTPPEIPMVDKEDSLEDLGIEEMREPEVIKEIKEEIADYEEPAPEAAHTVKKRRGITEVLVGLVTGVVR